MAGNILDVVVNFNYEQVMAGALNDVVKTGVDAVAANREVRYQFDHRMDYEDKCHSVVRVVEMLYAEGLAVKINGTNYEPKFTKPHLTGDNQPLLGLENGTYLHPQNIVVVSSKEKRNLEAIASA